MSCLYNHDQGRTGGGGGGGGGLGSEESPRKRKERSTRMYEKVHRVQKRSTRMHCITVCLINENAYHWRSERSE